MEFAPNHVLIQTVPVLTSCSHVDLETNAKLRLAQLTPIASQKFAMLAPTPASYVPILLPLKLMVAPYMPVTSIQVL
jgi:hypothetical protein